VTGVGAARVGPFDGALTGSVCVLELADGETIDLPVARWHAPPDAFDHMMLARCAGRTLDVGCGPGRLTTALAERGVPALGVDISPVAVELTRLRGAPALCADVFGRIPAEGRWRHVLLADGNVGIGGDPAALLARVAVLLARHGTALVELDPPGTGLRRAAARFAAHGTWFPRARLAVDAVGEPAVAAGFHVRSTAGAGGRWFAELVKR
jgi:SAM-dependent methyltransferase